MVQPLLIHMVRPFANGNDSKFCLQIKGNVLWEKRKLDRNLKKLFAVLQANLRLNEYKLKESAYDRVSNLLNTKTRTFVTKVKALRFSKLKLKNPSMSQEERAMFLLRKKIKRVRSTKGASFYSLMETPPSTLSFYGL